MSLGSPIPSSDSQNWDFPNLLVSNLLAGKKVGNPAFFRVRGLYGVTFLCSVWAHSEGHPHTERIFTGTLVNVGCLRWNSGECHGGSCEHGVVGSPNFAKVRQSSHEGARMLLVHPETCLICDPGCWATSPKEDGCHGGSGVYFLWPDRPLRKGSFRWRNPWNSLKSLNSLDSLEMVGFSFCFPLSVGSLDDPCLSIFARESLQSCYFSKDPFSKRPPKPSSIF